MKTFQSYWKYFIFILLILGLVMAGLFFMPNKISCQDTENTTPIITSLSQYSGKNTISFDVYGCHFSGFEGDKAIWIQNEKGEKAILYGSLESQDTIIRITLQPELCQEDNSYTGFECKNAFFLIPGNYTIYTDPWGKKSNEISFDIL
jgi:hypothetical protein